MENSVIKIKCPCCGAVLAVKVQPGSESKKLTCPVCKESSPFKLYKQVSGNAQKEHTEYPGMDKGGNTKAKGMQNCSAGRLKVQSVSVPFDLKPGVNIIGRKASVSSANIQIPVMTSNRMSREHLVIEVKNVPGKGTVHYASLYKEKVNDTFINKERLEYGDCIILKDGDILELPEASKKFEIPDSEETSL